MKTEEIQKIIFLYDSGLTMETISGLFHRNKSTVNKILKSHGVVRERGEDGYVVNYYPNRNLTETGLISPTKVKSKRTPPKAKLADWAV